MKKNEQLQANDIVPDISQKVVDPRIGLDIARLSLTRQVDALVLVSGDSDLVPAFKFARREGVQVYLNYLAHGIKNSMRIHTDGVIDTQTSELASEANDSVQD